MLLRELSFRQRKRLGLFLDIESVGVANWETLGSHLNLRWEDIERIRYYLHPDFLSSQSFWDHFVVAHHNVSIQELINLCTDLHRNDVAAFLREEVFLPRMIVSEITKDHLCKLAFMLKTCSFGSDWQMIADHFGYTYQEIQFMANMREEDLPSPTGLLIDHLTGHDPDLSVSAVIEVLKELHRNDVVHYLESINN